MRLLKLKLHQRIKKRRAPQAYAFVFIDNIELISQSSLNSKLSFVQMKSGIKISVKESAGDILSRIQGVAMITGELE